MMLKIRRRTVVSLGALALVDAAIDLGCLIKISNSEWTARLNKLQHKLLP